MNNPTDHIGDIMDMDADAREEMDILLLAEEFDGPPVDLDADAFCGDCGLELIVVDQENTCPDCDDFGYEDFDPSGGLTEDDFPVVEDDNDYDNFGYGAAEAEAEAWHSQHDY